MGSPIPWHGGTRALPATWPSLGTTQRSRGSKWAAAWHRSTHFWPRVFFTLLLLPAVSQIQRTFGQVNEGILQNFGLSSQVKTCWVSWVLGYAKKENAMLYFLPFQAFYALCLPLQWAQLCLAPHLSVLWSYCELVLLPLVCVISCGLVFNLPYCQWSAIQIYSNTE